MHRLRHVTAAIGFVAVGSLVVFAQAQQQPQPPAQAPAAQQPPAGGQGGRGGRGGGGGAQNPTSFFVTSVGKGDGANYGGLAGADAYCQSMAAAAGRGASTWHAYLSTQGAGAV